ncbi:hypothetical protein QUF76_11700 [Desulfobacterales bacterium HSG16]|nr:hypothetical protein [Desulfobacterales bacterium HSG16]
MKKKTSYQQLVRRIILAITCFLIITGGVIGMNRMAESRKIHAPKETKPKTMSVAAIAAVKQDISLSVTGYGQANPVHVIEISPQVSGRIIEKHKALDQGGMVQKGETLFKIDATDYKIKAEKAEIQVKLQKNQIEQLKVSHEKDQGRLSTVRQNTKLANAEYLSLKTLYEKERVGTLSAVEKAEQGYNSLLDAEKNLVKSIALYPLMIAEAKSNLAGAKSDLKSARLNVKRCRLTAPFSGRVKDISIETGTYIGMGTLAMILADDRILEIQVPLSDKDAFEVLGLREISGNTTLLAGLKNIECRVETVTGNITAVLSGTLHRAVKYDSNTRTLYLAARVDLDDPGITGESIPLMDGMFCKVHLTGKPVMNAIKIPASAFNSNNTVFLSRDQKLKTLPVTKVMENGDYIYISGAFQPQDLIITTPLANPLENTRLDILNSSELLESSAADKRGRI